MRLAALVLAGVLAPAPALACRLALLLALDVSSSVDEREFILQRNGLAAALVAPEVQAAFLSGGEPVALAAFEWSGEWNQRVLLDWRLIRSGEDLLRAAEGLGATRRGETGFPTAVGPALGYAWRMFAAAPRCERQTLDVSGDGKHNHGFPPSSAYKAYDYTGTTVNALAIGGAVELEVLVPYFQSQVIRGPNAFVEVATDHVDFERAMRRKLEREVARAMAAVRPAKKVTVEN